MDLPANPDHDIPNAEVIDQLILTIYNLDIFQAAVELRLWEKVAAGDATAAGIAAHAGWDPVGTRCLLDAACALKLMRKEGEHYFLVPESAVYLIPGMPTYKGELVTGERSWEGNGQLAEAIRSGRRPVQYNAVTPGVAGLWIVDYARSWVYPESQLETSGALWRSLDVQGRDSLQVLDIACGPAPRSMALARQHPGVRLTWLDWEAVLETALKAAARLWVEGQVLPLPGDLWSTNFGEARFDLAYLGNLTHFFSPGENTRLFRKTFQALAPGGVIVVNSAARWKDDMPPWLELWLYAVSASGGAYSFDEYRSMLEQAGFEQVQDIDGEPIKAVKPGLEKFTGEQDGNPQGLVGYRPEGSGIPPARTV